MSVSERVLNDLLDALGVEAAFVSAHTAVFTDPTAPSEVTGGTTAYARKAITWNAASSGGLDSSNAPVLDIPAGSTIEAIGFWNLGGDGTTNQTVAAYVAQLIPSTAVVFGAQGTLTLTDVDWAAV